MTDLCLKFPDEAAAFAALYEPVTKTVTTYDEDGNTTSETVIVEGEFKLSYSASIDAIGVIHEAIGELDSEGNFLTAAIPGWHINLRGEFTEEQLAELAPYIVTPESPVRVWA